MAQNANFFKNLGKSVAYSSMDVLGRLAPNTIDLARDARSGVDSARDFMRDNLSKIRVSTTQIDRNTISRKARAYLDDAMSDIKKGNISLGDMSDNADDEFNDILSGLESESDIDTSSEDVKPRSKNGVDLSGLSSAADRRASLRGMQEMQTVLGNTIINTTKYQTDKLSTAMFAQMSSQTQQFNMMNKQLGSINENLTQLIKFQRDSQGVTNQSQLVFFDHMTKWMEREDKRQRELANGKPNRRKNPIEGFMSSGYFDKDAYKKIVKSNFNNSELGSVVSSIGMLSPDMIQLMLGSQGGKIQPQKLILDALLHAAVPKGARRAIGRGDNQVNTMMKTMLGRLGSYKYQMDEHPILGVLGSLFGIDTRAQRTMRLGDYKHGATSWNGEAHKVLVTVIPKELAEIKEAILKTGEAKYYDAQTGTYRTKESVRERTKVRYQDAVETPFANIFNKEVSMDPDDISNRKLWAKMSEDIQKQIDKIVNTAVTNNSGFSDDLTRKLDTVMQASVGSLGGSAVDAQRMVMKLVEAVNIARDQTARYIKDLQENDSAFSQIATEMGDQYGKISFSKLQEFMGAENVNLIEANSARYTQGGKRKSSMSEEERASYESTRGFIRNLGKKFSDMQNSPDARIAGFGKLMSKGINTYIHGSNSKYSRGVTKVVNDIFSKAYKLTMLGDIDQSQRDDTIVPPVVNDAADATVNQIRSVVVPQKVGQKKRRKKRKPSTDDSGDSDGEAAPSGGIVNESFARDTSQVIPEERTADATEETRDTIDSALGKKGYLAKFFSSSLMKKLMSMFNNSKFGKSTKEKLGQGKEYIKKLFMDDYTDEEGVTHKSVKSNLKTALSSYSDFIFEKLGFDPKSGKQKADAEGTPVDAVNKATENIDAVSEAITGDNKAGDGKKKTEETSKKILGSMNAFMRKHAPKVLTGGVIGAGASLATGGSLGILGGLFLPGGPIGGAILGMGLTVLSQTEAFQSLLFGKKNEMGEREGGFISKKMSEGFKKALPTLGKGAAAGSVIGLAAKFLGVKGGALGIIPNMMLPGGIMGAAIMGSAAAFALKNEKVQDILFGQADKDGKRTGTLLSNAYNKFTGKIKDANGQKKGFSGADKLKGVVKGLGIGALTAGAVGQMGLLGSAFSLGGPVGGAIAGAAIGIASSSNRFNDYLFGTKDAETGKRKKDGLLSRFQTAIDLKFLEPATAWFKDTMVDFAWWSREKIEVPFRLAFGPIIDSFADLRDVMKEGAVAVIKKIGDKIGGGIMKILNPIKDIMLKNILSPLGKLAGGVLKTGLFAAGSAVSMPLQALALLMSPKRRKGEKKFGGFLSEHRDENLESRWAQQGEAGEKVNKTKDKLMYGLATLPGVGKFFRKNEMIAGMAKNYEESPEGEGRNSLSWLTAPYDKKVYHQERKKARKEAKEEGKIRKIRQGFGKEDGYNRDAILSSEEFARRQRVLSRKGIKIKDETELKKFTYDYDAWKSPGETPKPGEVPPEETIRSDVGIIRGLMQNFQGMFESYTNLFKQQVDIDRANFDITSGGHADSSDFEPGDVADKIDTNTAEKIHNIQTKNQAQATVDAFTEQAKRAKRQSEHDKVTGNTSGNAHDGDPVIGAVAGETDEDGEATDKKSSIFDKLSGGALGGIISMIAKLPGVIPIAVAGITAALLGNEDVREFLASGIKAAGSFLMDQIKKIPGLISDGAADVLGVNGGVNNQRALEVDENGNATRTVTNTTALTRVANVLATPGASLKAAQNMARAIPGAKTVERLVTGAQKVGGRIWGAAQSAAVNGAAKAAGGHNLTLVEKAMKFIKEALETAAASKLGKTFKGLSKLMGKIGSFFKVIYDKLLGKNLVKWADDLAAALVKMGVVNVSWVTPAALLTAGLTAGAAILGAINPEKMFKIDPSQVDWKMRLISSIFEGVMMATGVGAVVGLISEIVSEYTGFDFIQTLADIFYRIISGDEEGDKLSKAMSDMKQEVANYNDANGTNISLDAYNDLKNKGLLGGAWNGIKNIFGQGDTTDYSQYSVDNYNNPNYSTEKQMIQAAIDQNNKTAREAVVRQRERTTTTSNPTTVRNRRERSLGSVGYGPGDTQNDSRWANKALGRFPSGRISTMKDGGCGPTALSNAAAALGVRTDPGSIAQFASQNGYLSQGGANDNLFDVGANQMGLNTQRVNNGQSIAANLKQGKPVILAGKSTGGRGTPYTKAGHIVTATGMDGQGNVTVQDPTSRSKKKYKLKDLESRMTNGWAVSRGGASGYGLFEDIFGSTMSSITDNLYSSLGIQKSDDEESRGGTFGTNKKGFGGSFGAGSGKVISQTESAKKVWAYLKGAGYTDAAAAGIMGCWQQESSNRADRIEGDHLKGFPGFQKTLESNQSLNAYTSNTLFPAYARSNISINQKAYKGEDGNFYPGVGLAQWTGPRGHRLFQFAQEQGKDWRDLDTQLAFFKHEIEDRGLKAKFNAATSAAEAAHLVLDHYEMYPGFGAKSSKYLNPRQEAANNILATYANTTQTKKPGAKEMVDRQRGGNLPGYGKPTGYGLLSDALGGAFGTLMESAGGAVMAKLTGKSYEEGLASYRQSKGTDGVDDNIPGAEQNTVSGGTPVFSGSASEGQKKVVNQMNSIYGSLRYSLDGNEQDPDKGVASCASTVGWAYRKALGVKGLSASSTEQSKHQDFQTVWTNDGNNPLPVNMLQPGDILYQNWSQTKNNGKMKHTEMYAGGGKDLSHGGGKKGEEKGPTFKEVDDYRRSRTMMVRRYKPFMNQSTGYGFGDEGAITKKINDTFSVSNTGRRESDLVTGYGPGATAITSGNRNVETRLDTIIGVLRSIAETNGVIAKHKPVAGGSQVNVNYGKGDTTTVTQPVVVQKEDKRLGAEDAENANLRQMHMKLASVERFNM